MRVHKLPVRANLIALLVLGFMILAAMPMMAYSQSQAEQYFPETGHIVRGEFLDFFNARGGLRVFGYPITEEFKMNGRTVQYFQHARLELHPENPAGSRVQLGLLGEEVGKRSPSQAATNPNSYVQRYFPETGHSVIYAFLNFFDKYGGIDTFGYPLSDYGQEYVGGRIVQYFQRAKLEWYPELASEQRVQLADLGSIQFDLLASQGKIDPALKKPVPAPATLGNVPLSLKVSATTKDTITTRHTNQTLYVYVTDQKNTPVKDADVTFSLHDASGTKNYSMPPTDANGFTSYTFDAGELRPAQTVFMTATATANEVTGTDRTSFFTWF